MRFFMCDAFYGRCVFLKKWVNVRCVLWNEWAMRLKVNECTMRFMCVFFFEFVCLLWSCRYEMSCSDETDFHRTMKWSVHLVSWYPIRLVHLRFHRLVVGESPPWLLSVDWTLVTNDVLAHWERVFPSSDYASSLSMYVFMCVIFFHLDRIVLGDKKSGCSSHVFCETGESGLSSHIQLRFYSGLFT